MVEGVSTVLWFAGGAFGLCFFSRTWWFAALVTLGVTAMAWGAPPVTLLTGAVAVGIPAFAGAALGKFIKHRNRDPFDALERRE